MSETELKFTFMDLDAVAGTLQQAGAKRQGKWFEENIVFDAPGRSLKNADILLRLRQTRSGCTLTLKKPPQEKGPEGFKHKEEIETTVADYNAMRAILESLGYSPAFSYEKMREEWTLDGVTVCLDLLPFGRFVELEGEAGAIIRAAEKLSLPMERSSRASYYELHRQRSQAMGQDPNESFVFADKEKAFLLRQVDS